MKMSTKALLIALIEPMFRRAGKTSSFVQIPGLLIRRFVLLTLACIGSLIFLAGGLSLFMSGIMELSVYLEAPWIVPLTAGGILSLTGIVGLFVFFGKEKWSGPIEKNEHEQQSSAHPLERLLLLAIQYFEERQAKREPAMPKQNQENTSSAYSSTQKDQAKTSHWATH